MTIVTQLPMPDDDPIEQIKRIQRERPTFSCCGMSCATTVAVVIALVLAIYLLKILLIP